MASEGTLQALLAALVSGQCYPLTAPQGIAGSYITYRVISNVPEVNLDGPNGLENRRFQVDIWGGTYREVKTIEGQVKTAMAAASTAGTLANVPLSSLDDYEPDTQLFRVTMDFSVWSN